MIPPPTLPDRRRRLVFVALHAAIGLAWSAISSSLIPSVLRQAYEGRSVSILNRIFEGRQGRPLTHFLELWDLIEGAVLIGIGFHLAVSLLILEFQRRTLWTRDPGGTLPRLVWTLRGFALAFLSLTLIAGARHDYVADLEIWERVLRGGDPWWLIEGRGYPLNAYGPLFNPIAWVAWINPLMPKFAFSFAYLGFVLWLFEELRFRGKLDHYPWLAMGCLVLNPLPWVEIAYFGHFDVLVGVACVVAIEMRLKGRDRLSGAWLAAGVLLKYLPVVILPFLAVIGGRVRTRLVVTALALIAAGMGLSTLVWGGSTFRPITFAATRGSNLLSIFRFLRGRFSPLGLVWESPNLDRLSVACMAVAGVSVFAWCQIKRVEIARGALMGLLVTLLFYQVGFLQYQIVLFLVAASWTLRSPVRPRATVAILLYFGWLAAFDLFYAAIDGIIRPGGRWAWVEDLAGLPTFVLGLAVLIDLIRPEPTFVPSHHPWRDPSRPIRP